MDRTFVAIKRGHNRVAFAGARRAPAEIIKRDHIDRPRDLPLFVVGGRHMVVV
jgi:hypothetical protein